MEVDVLLKKIEMLNDTYIWAISESNKIVREMHKLRKSDDFKKYEKMDKLKKRFSELQSRHIADKKLYDQVVMQSRDYFKNKYNIDIKKVFGRDDEKAD